MNGTLTYHCTPSVAWVRDASQTLAVDEETGQSWILRGVEAAAWDLLTVGHTYHGTVSLLALICSVPAAEAARMLDSLLRRWREANLLQVFEEADDGEPDHQRGL